MRYESGILDKIPITNRDLLNPSLYDSQKFEKAIFIYKLCHLFVLSSLWIQYFKFRIKSLM